MEQITDTSGAGAGSNKYTATESLESGEQKNKTSIEIWNDIQLVSNSVNKKLQDWETFKRALEALSSPAPEKKANQKDWTIAINYTTDFGEGQGVESGMQMLTDFAHKTKGKNVAIVAQFAIPDSNEFDEFGEQIVHKDTKYQLETYIVKDGEIKKVQTSESKGYAEDLKTLVAFASKNEPSKRMGLIIDSHGSGNDGLNGDTGHASVDEFVKSVKDGLKGSGREKLDMLDFDTCLMAQNGAMQKIKVVADQVVASAQTEGIYNAQNYLDPIARLMEKPETDGFTLARDIVAQTHKDMQDWKKEGWNPAVETLSHFNMRQYDNFKKCLDQFGEQLIPVLNDTAGKACIESAIDNARKYGGSGNLLSMLFGDKFGGKHRTDLKDFTERIISGIDSGEIKDPDRVLKKAAQDLLTLRGNFVDSYHGEGDYRSAGGISVFLPGRNLRNLEKEAQLKTPAGRLSDLTDPKNFASINNSEKSRKEFLALVEQEMFFTRPNFFLIGIQGVDKNIKEIDNFTAEFRQAATDKQREEALKQLHQAAHDLGKTEPLQKMQASALHNLQENVAQIYKANFIEETKESGWSKFRLKLRDGK